MRRVPIAFCAALVSVPYAAAAQSPPDADNWRPIAESAVQAHTPNDGRSRFIPPPPRGNLREDIVDAARTQPPQTRRGNQNRDGN